MAALGSITAVRPTQSTRVQKVRYGATVAAGQVVYLDATTSDSRFKLTDSNVTRLTTEVRGIVITPGADGDWGLIAVAGSVILVGTTMVRTEPYFVGAAAAGTIVPKGDLVANDWVAQIGYALSTTEFQLNMIWFGVQVPT